MFKFIVSAFCFNSALVSHLHIYNHNVGEEHLVCHNMHVEILSSEIKFDIPIGAHLRQAQIFAR